MKKILLIALVLVFAGTTRLFSANPIPSYNVKVEFRANFQETSNERTGNQAGKDRRLMNIETSTASPTNNKQNSTSIVYVYKLKGHKVLGPFVVDCGEMLSVQIDNNKWGVLIEQENPNNCILASVWIGSNSHAALPANTLLPEVQKDSYTSDLQIPE